MSSSTPTLDYLARRGRCWRALHAEHLDNARRWRLTIKLSGHRRLLPYAHACIDLARSARAQGRGYGWRLP